MAEWKKVIVSGSNISQLNNDIGYATNADDTELVTAILVNNPIGDWANGATISSGTSIEDIVRTMLVKYQNPSLAALYLKNNGSNIITATATREAGNSFVIDEITFTSSPDDPDGLYPTPGNLTVSGNDTAYGPQALGTIGATNSETISPDLTVNIATPAATGGTVTFTVSGTAQGGNNDTISTNRIIYFRWKNYLRASSTVVTDDASAQTVLNSTDISSALDTNKAWTATCSSDNNDGTKYTYIMYPAAYGDLSGIIQNGSLPVLGAFTKLGDFTVDNAYGSSISLRVYKSNATGAFASGTSLAIS